MRKGKNSGELTYHQMKMLNQDYRRQIADLTQKLEKLQHDYDSLKTAHNKLLKEQPKQQLSSAYGSVGPVSSPGFMW